MNPIYFDNNATTQPLPAVGVAVKDAMDAIYGNVSSHHRLGRQAEEAQEEARQIVMETFRVEDAENVLFTAGGTDSIDHAFSILFTERYRRIIVSSVEHRAVQHAAHRWARGRNCQVCEVAVDRQGNLVLDHLRDLLKDGPAFVSLMVANNETGVLFDIATAASLVRSQGGCLHLDAVQVPGRLPLEFDALDCDALSVSAHKFHGPKGCGVLLLGSGETRGVGGDSRRGGTANVPAIVGCKVALEHLNEALREMARVEKLRDELEARLLREIPGGMVNGAGAPRLPQTSNFYFPNRNAAELVEELDSAGICVSAAAACTEGGKPSHVLRAMKLGESQAGSSLRLSFSRHTTRREIEEAGTAIAEIYHAGLLI